MFARVYHQPGGCRISRLRLNSHPRHLRLGHAGALLKSLLDIQYYIELQRRILDIFRYVSCHERNFDTYSVVLESLLIDTCSFFDSSCQTFIREKSLAGHAFKQESSVVNFQKKVSGNAEFNFADYRELLEDDFVLSTKKVNLNPYEDVFYSNPMHYVPDTGLKHDRLTSFREARLRNVIHSLAAVFIILTLRNEAEFKAGSVSLELYELGLMVSCA